MDREPEKQRHIKIISDGTFRGWKVVDGKTGEDIDLVYEADLHMDVHSGPRVTIKMYCCECDWQSEHVSVSRKCPYTGKMVSEMVKEDGHTP